MFHIFYASFSSESCATTATSDIYAFKIINLKVLLYKINMSYKSNPP